MNFDCNETVRLDFSGKHPSLTIPNLDKLEEPPSLTQLSRQVNELLPKVDLTELLLEIHAHTGFVDEFTHVSESNARAEDLTTSICAVVTNSVVLWNTIYMQAALDHLSQQSFETSEEDKARLSPLPYGHLNVLGHYSFFLAESIMKGGLRPLNRLTEPIYTP